MFPTTEPRLAADRASAWRTLSTVLCGGFVRRHPLATRLERHTRTPMPLRVAAPGEGAVVTRDDCRLCTNGSDVHSAAVVVVVAHCCRVAATAGTRNAPRSSTADDVESAGEPPCCIYDSNIRFDGKLAPERGALGDASDLVP